MTVMNPEEKTMTLEEILSEMYDFSEYSEEERLNMIGETSAMITEAALLRSLEGSDEMVQKQFEELMETDPNEDQVMEFVNAYMPNFQEILGEEIQIFHSMSESDNDETKTTTE